MIEKKKRSRLKFWATAATVMLVLVAGLALLRARMSRPDKRFVALQNKLAQSEQSSVTVLTRSKLGVIENSSLPASLNQAIPSQENLSKPSSTGAKPQQQRAESSDAFFAPVVNMQFGRDFNLSSLKDGFGVWHVTGLEWDIFNLGFSEPKKSSLTQEQREKIIEGVRRNLARSRLLTPKEAEYQKKENVKNAWDKLPFDESKAMESWKTCVDQTEEFFLQEPWEFPRPERTLNDSYYRFTHNYYYMPRFASIALARAISRGNLAHARKIYLRAVDLVRYMQCSSYPRTLATSGWANDFQLLSSAWDHAEELGPETFAQAAKIIEQARLSPEDFKALWPEFVMDAGTQTIEQFDERAKNLFRDSMGGSWRSYFFQGAPQGYVSKAFYPIARREIERMTVAYAEFDFKEVASAANQLKRLESVMNISLPDGHWFSEYAGRGRIRLPDPEKLLDPTGYNRTVDEARILLATMQFRSEHRRMPRSIDELVPAYMERKIIERENTHWEVVAIPPFRRPDTTHRSLQYSENRVRDDVYRKLASELPESIKKFAAANKRGPENAQELRPYLSNPEHFQYLKHLFVDLPETTVILEYPPATSDNPTPYRVRFWVESWPMEEFEPLFAQ